MADGNIDDHNMVKKAARECGVNHVFTSVYNGSQLMDYLNRKKPYNSYQNGHPDLLLMDIDLDLVSGWEILSYLSERNPQHISVYVLTANKNEEDAVRAMHFGVKDYFQKPLQYDQWRKMVGDICQESFKASHDSHREHNL
jgi:DNA-binding response OmpR family regulator